MRLSSGVIRNLNRSRFLFFIVKDASQIANHISHFLEVFTLDAFDELVILEDMKARDGFDLFREVTELFVDVFFTPDDHRQLGRKALSVIGGDVLTGFAPFSRVLDDNQIVLSNELLPVLKVGHDH